MVTVGAQQEIRQRVEVVFQGLLVEGNPCQPQKVILEIVQIPSNGLPIKAVAWITNAVIEVLPGFNLKPRQYRDSFPVGIHDLRTDVISGSVPGKELKQGCVTQVLLDVRAFIQVLGIDCRNRQIVLSAIVRSRSSKNPCKFAHRVVVRRLLVVVLVLMTGCVGARTNDVTIGTSVFHVQIAATEALREHGLMGVKTLAADHGMLFVWKDVAPRDFYMKDTLISLDLISIRGGAVVGVATMTPCKADPCPITNTPPADAALEVNAGTAKGAGIAAGALVESTAL